LETISRTGGGIGSEICNEELVEEVKTEEGSVDEYVDSIFSVRE
jgi:hypothetical protein